MKTLLLALGTAAISTVAADSSLKSALLLHASFDRPDRADFAKGDPILYSAPGMKAPKHTPGLPASGYVSHVKEGGKSGGHLRFNKKSDEMVFFAADKNVNYATNKLAGSVSFWLNVSPDEDLAPGYTDPIQITSKKWDEAAFFCEFTKDEKPREFRLGAYADFKVWNPQNRPWDQMSFAEKPLVKVERPPFKRGQWTHIVFTFNHYNSGKPNAETHLYLNGEPAGALSPRLQTFTWDIADAKIMLGLSYIGGYDELSIFDRALTPAEVKTLHTAVRPL